jgi:RNA polymerase sigma-70 factor (ECF subfamily)
MATAEGERLARAFVEASGLAPDGAALARLGATFAGALGRARARFAGVDVGGEAFAAELGRRLGEGDDPTGALEALYLDDLLLARACAAGDRAALAHFEREILRQVGDFVAGIDRSPAFADEVRQRLGERLFARGGGAWGGGAPGGGARGGAIDEYGGRGPLGAWVRVAATRVALNLRRGARREGRRAASVEEAVGAALDLAYVKERYREPFAEALREALLDLPPHQRALLRLYHVEGLSLEAMAALYRAHLSTVSRRLARAREQVAEGATRRLRERLGASASEVESLVPLVLSRLEMSFERLLGEPG